MKQHTHKPVPPMQQWRTALLWMAGCLVAILLANLIGLRLSGGGAHFAMGDGFDKLFIRNFYKVEETDHIAYRWTTAESSIVLHGVPPVSHPALSFRIGGVPPTVPTPHPLQVRLNGDAWLTMAVQAEPRRYTLMLPSSAIAPHDGTVQVDLLTETHTVPPDERSLGVRLDSVSLAWFAPWVLAPWQMLLVQWLIVLVTAVLAHNLALPRWCIAAAVAVVVVGLGWSTAAHPLIAWSWHSRLLVAALATLILYRGSFPLLCRLLPGAAPHRELRWLWLITIGGLALRMTGILYPPFDSHDWYIHRRRIHDFINGAFILYDQPAEFSRKLTIVPPAPYLLYLPFTLLTEKTFVAMQGVYTFFDGVSVLCVGVLVRLVGGSARAARLAALVLALFPLTYVALWWGFGPQVIGQSLVLLLALFAAHQNAPPRVIWLFGGVVFCLLLLSHVGAGILGGFWLAGFVALLWWHQRREHPQWHRWAVLLVGCGILVTLLLYVDVIALQFQGLSDNSRLGWDDGDYFRYVWTLESLFSSFFPLGIVVPLLSVVFLVHRTQGHYRWLVNSWLVSAELFFVVDLAFGLQVRYAYFLVPLIAAGLGLLLDRLIARHRAGWLVAACLIGAIGVAGLALWYSGTVVWIKPSLRGLTH